MAALEVTESHERVGWTALTGEAREEIGAEIEIIPATQTWFLPADGNIRTIVVDDEEGIPHPLAFYEMRHLPGQPRCRTTLSARDFCRQITGFSHDTCA